MNAAQDPGTHPDEEQLFGLANHLATEEGEELARLQEHVERCEECQRKMAELGGVVTKTPRREPPPEMRARFLEDLAEDQAEREGKARKIPFGLLVVLVGLLPILGAGAMVWLPGEPPREEAPSAPRGAEDEEKPPGRLGKPVVAGHDDDDGSTKDGVAPPSTPGG